MPFTSQEARKKMAAAIPFVLAPGDRCFFFYVTMMRAWKKERRWTTADKIREWVDMQELDPSWNRAKKLAWDVFFWLEVMPYELEMKSKSGAVTGNERIAQWVFEAFRKECQEFILPSTPEALNEEGKQ
jgi:hypothetical protein